MVRRLAAREAAVEVVLAAYVAARGDDGDGNGAVHHRPHVARHGRGSSSSDIIPTWEGHVSREAAAMEAEIQAEEAAQGWFARRASSRRRVVQAGRLPPRPRPTDPAVAASAAAETVWGEPVRSYDALFNELEEGEAGWRLEEAAPGLAEWGISAMPGVGPYPLCTEEDVAELSDLTEPGGLEGWKEEVNDAAHMLRVWTKPTADNPALRRGAASFILRGWTLSQVSSVLVDVHEFASWDFTWNEVWPVRRLDPCNSALYFLTDNAPPPVTSFVPARDFAMTAHVHIDDSAGEHALLIRTLPHRLTPPRPPFVRGTSHGCSGFLMQRLGPREVRVTMMTATDPRGSIPAYFVNWITRTAPTRWWKRFTEAIQAVHGPPVADR